MSIDDDKIDLIIEAHTEPISALKTENGELKDQLAELENIRAERDALKKAAENSGKDEYKEKYEALKAEFDKFKGEISAKETRAAKESAYRTMLKEIGISERRIDSIVKVESAKIDGLELDKGGKIKDVDKYKKDAETEWSEFVERERTTGTQTAQPPINTGGTVNSKNVIYAKENGKYKLSAEERQAAIAERLAANNGEFK